MFRVQPTQGPAAGVEDQPGCCADDCCTGTRADDCCTGTDSATAATRPETEPATAGCC